MLGVKERKLVCWFCKTRNHGVLFNVSENKMQNYCYFCDSWTTLTMASPAYIKAKPQPRFFFSKPPTFRGASTVEIINRSNLPEPVKLWAMYRSIGDDSEYSHVFRCQIASYIYMSLKKNVVNRAKTCIGRLKDESKVSKTLIYIIIIEVAKANRAGKAPSISLIAEKVGIDRQAIYPRRRWSKSTVSRKTNAMVSKEYRPPVMRLIDEIQGVTKGLELAWHLGRMPK